jgi:carboxyl-terminal processing protease
MLRSGVKVIFILNSFSAVAQMSVSVEQEAAQLKKNLLEHHVSPRPIDDLFSQDVFKIFFELLDPEKLYFTSDEINQFSGFNTKIDDELNGLPWNFLKEVTLRLKLNLERAEAAIGHETNKAFDFTDEDIYFGNVAWATNETDYVNRWRLHLKREALNELVRIRKASSDIPEKDFLVAKEADARKNVKKFQMRAIDRIVNHPNGYEQFVASLYLRAIGLAFDPHSAHFSFSEMQGYMTSLSTEGFYFGITVDENERGEVIIGELTPGGPAWRSGTVHSGDIIEKVRWGANAWIETNGMSREEMNELLMESNHEVMEFMLLQSGGLRQSVLLRKERMESEENVVKSLILEGTKRIGYISLPGFYSAWGGSENSRCANDVAKEILKLKKEGIDGLILDVRYNRGGSLYEAVAMAGIFIDAGPMGLLKDRTGIVTSVKDMNRGTVYDGPLILMVNGYSASASEFLAAALQDYNRAIIVGSKTYGKGTGQRIFPMQPGKTELDPTLDMKSGWGFSTITSMKIYRVTGKTAQKNGVTPDIVLPDLHDLSEFGEAYATGALTSDSVSKKTYYTPLKALNLEDVKDKSDSRVKASEAFRLTTECSRQLRDFKEKLDSVSLTWTGYSTLVENEARIFTALEQITRTPTKSFKIAAHTFNQQRMQLDEYARTQHDTWTGNLARDISLEEAFYIICDYIAASSAN